MADRVGQQLGNYRLLILLGKGGFAEVYLGQHLRFNQQAAIKLLHMHLTSTEAEHFQYEAETIARLAHPGIVCVFDFDVQEGVPFLVMEYAPNGSLRRRHPKGEVVPLPTLLSYVKQVAGALQYAHEHKVIHRDVKPENMLLGRREEVLLSDFGLATIAHSTGSLSTSAQGTGGTIAYMAPEQIEGHPRTASDQYALGAMVYEWLCGQRPFEGSLSEVIVQHLSMPPPSLRERVPTISPTVEQVVLRALAKDPNERFASVASFAQAMEQACREDASGQTLPLLASGYPAEARHRVNSRPHLPTGTVTLLFTDIEGSTRLLQQVGELYADMLAECRDLLRTAFRGYHGHEVDTQGDAFFVAFARASEAISAVMSAQRALTTHSWPEGVVVRVRMGIHTGEPSLISEGYVGLDVHHAALIMSVGHGGQVLLSQTTRDLVEHDLPDGVSLRDLGEHRLKDLQRPSHLYQLVIVDLPADFPPLETLESRPNNLPVQWTPLIGREREVATVQHLLQRETVRLVTLTGPGGTGKTRMALQVAAELIDLFPDGVYFVSLAPISNAAFVIPTIAQTLGLREVAGQPLLEHLKRELQQKHLLLVLDNFEQVVRAAPQLVDLLAACPTLKLLVTSREVLHVRAEHEFAVPPLALPDPTHLPELAELSHYAAVTLFMWRAQAARPDFQVTTANARAIAEICVRLDGLPLAIELAAARVKLLPPQALLARLGHRLEVLTSSAQDVSSRHQTLRNTIAWSYQLLDAQEQQLFRRLSVFVGGCTLEAIETVCIALDKSNGAGRVLDGAASLIDKSLLQQTEQEGDEPRLVMLETIREYGWEVLTASGEMGMTRQAHAEFYLRLAEETEPELRGAQSVLRLERLEREHDNLRAVMQWLLEQERAGQRKEMALRLGSALEEFWYVCGPYSEGRAFLEQALAGSEGVAPSVRAKALDTSGKMVGILGDQDRAQVLHEESLALSQALGDPAGIARSLQGLGWVERHRGNYTAARRLSTEALALWREVGDKERVASTLRLLGLLHDTQGEHERARTLYEESLVLRRELGNKSAIADSLRMLAHELFHSQGDPMAVRSLLEEGLALYRETGGKNGIGYCLGLSAQVALSQGEVATARRLAEESVALQRETGDQLGMMDSLSLLGEVEASQGNYETARSLYEESLAIARKTGDKGGIAFNQEEFARVIAAQGELTWAARLWGSAEVLKEAIGAPRSPFDRVSYERAVAAARAQLGDKAFATAWAQGRSMTADQALVTQTPKVGAISGGPSSAPSTKVPTLYPDGLTAREVEVLRLVAQGLTDAQVAQQLVISPHTVNSHLKAIYGKIGGSSRSAATRYAIEHHLV
jgi:predicted ATPase/class 3 adenylate cyclase/DNA-binding CsgD family transcriptional regulator